MVKCTKCGAKIPVGMRICPDCGSKVGAGTSSSKRPEVAASQPPPQVNPVVGVIVMIVTLVVIYYLLSAFGINLLDFSGSEVGKCDPVAGKIACGFCAADMQCSYCSEGHTCNYATPGDTCSKLTCGGSSGATTDTRTIAQKYCQPGYCLSNGHCCPSNMRYYCEGSCYATDHAANSASNGRCYNYNIYC